jgi:hypothetical protein
LICQNNSSYWLIEIVGVYMRALSAISLLIVFVASQDMWAQETFQTDPVLVDFARKQLENAEVELEKALSKVQYKDPGASTADRPHLVSQSAWEKLIYETGTLSPRMKEALEADPESRTNDQEKFLRTIYLCNIHSDSQAKLRPLYQRVSWLRRYVSASNQNGYLQKDADQNSVSYLLQRIVEPYRNYTTDPKPIQAEAVAFLRQVVFDIHRETKIRRKTLEMGEACLKKGSRDPIVRMLVMQLVFEKDLRRRSPEYWKELPEIEKQLARKEYPRLLNVMTKRLKCYLFLIHSPRAIPDKKVIEAFEWMGDAIVDLFDEERHVPEHADSLYYPIRQCVRLHKILGRKMLPMRRALIKKVESSKSVDWAKAFFLEEAYLSLGADESLDKEFGYIKLAEKWGKRASQKLPLSVLPVSSLMYVGYCERDRRKQRKYFDEGISRRADNYNLFKGHLHYLAIPTYGWVDKESNLARDFVLEVAASKNWEEQVPGFAFRMADYIRRYDAGADSDPKLFGALQNVLVESEKRGLYRSKLKGWRQFLVFQALRSGEFKQALRLGKELNGELGFASKFRGRNVTLSRLAVLGDATIENIEDSIDRGTLEAKKIDQLIEQLSLNRMELDSSSGVYVDELVDLMGMIKDYESGEWAELTSDSKHMLPWHTRTDLDAWTATDNAIVCDTPTQSLKWRWPCTSPYMIEADILNERTGEAEKDGAFRDGFWASRNIIREGPYRSKFVFVDSSRSNVGIMDKQVYFCEVPFQVKKNAPNRLRMRVWGDYFDFTVDGVLAGYGVSPFDLRGHAILGKESKNSKTTFTNVRIRKMPLPSPLGDNRESEKYWNKRVEFEEESSDVWAARAKIRMLDPTKQDAAIVDCKTAIKRSPDKPEPLCELAKALVELGRDQDALPVLERSVTKFPKDMQSKLLLSALLSSSSRDELRDGKRALEIAKETNSMRWEQRWLARRVIAAAQAENGLFRMAIATQKKIIKTGMYSVSLKSLENDLKKFEAKEPLRRSITELTDPYQMPENYLETRKPVKVQRGLKAMWNFDHGVEENIQSIPTKSLGDARIVEGKVRGALALGVPQHDDRVDSVDFSETINRLAPFTITFWVLPKNKRGIILANGRGQLSALRITSEEKRLLVELMGREVTMVGAKTVEETLPTERWTHVAISFNGENKKPLFNLYINGEPRKRQHFLSRTRFMSPGGSTFQIGAACSEVSVGGMVDELRVYSRELTPKEVKTVMNYGTEGK